MTSDVTPPRESREIADPETSAAQVPQADRAVYRKAQVIERDVAAKPADPHDHVLRAWEAQIEPSLADLAAAYEEGALGNGFTFPLFDGESAHIRIRRYEPAGDRAGVFRGAVADEPASLAVLAFVDGAESGTIQLPSRGEVYRVRAGADGTVRLEQVDVHAMGECGVCAGHAQAQSTEPPSLDY
ncbi:MAG: hypothetical protein JJU00_06970 [Opitutales bacterium]|nr:hypothetical protein [Opitutales bacterium]